MRRQLGIALIVSCATCFSGTAIADATETLTLDTHVSASAGAAGPVSTAAPLLAGSSYDVVVTGTMSIWPVSQWSHAGEVCGASEEQPLFPSPGTVNGPTGWDAETTFAVPPGVNFFNFSCVPSQIPFLSTTHSPGGFQISVSGAAGFAHVIPVGGEQATPTANHSYTYAVTGTGQAASFRFVDDPVSDDYGVFQITVLTAAGCAAGACEHATAGAVAPTAPSTSGKLAVAGSSAIDLPRKCRSRRAFPVHFRVSRGVKIASVTELINGRLIHTFTTKIAPHLATVGVNLRGLPAGTFRLELRVTTTRGQVLRASRTYHTCKPGPKARRPSAHAHAST